MLLFTAQNPTEKVTAQIWRPNIDQFIQDDSSEKFTYYGNRFPKFSVWPGKLFLNYSFIKVGEIGCL